MAERISTTHLLRNTSIVSLIDITSRQVTESASQWNTATAAVELLAVDCLASVVCCDDTPNCRCGTRLIAFTQHFIVDSLGQSLDSILLRLGFQPVLRCISSSISFVSGTHTSSSPECPNKPTLMTIQPSKVSRFWTFRNCSLKRVLPHRVTIL